jgi:NAD(P)-dependent dehydrogenase (short-subunit alcohol dehydrogenase family)
MSRRAPIVCLITGATDGIGKATAMRLGAMGYQLLLHGRNPIKLAQACAEVAAVSAAEPAAYLADFATLADVARLATMVAADYPKLQILINNAGLLTDHRQTSSDGYELTFAVNYLAPALLTRLLLTTLKKNTPARIVNVASTAMGGGVINFGDLQMTEGFDGWQAYANSKLANVLFSYVLAARLTGSGVVSNSLCPGLVDTNFFHTNRVFADGIYERMQPGMRPPEEGADIPVHLASDPDTDRSNGRFFLRRRDMGTGTIIHSVSAGEDTDTALKLWQVTEAMLADYL